MLTVCCWAWGRLIVIYPERLHWRKLALSDADISSVRCGNQCVPLPLHAGTPSGLNCVEPVCIATVSVNLYVHPCCCVWRTLFPWRPSPLALTLSLAPLPHTSLSPGAGGLMKVSHLRLSAAKPPTLSILSSCGS